MTLPAIAAAAEAPQPAFSVSWGRALERFVDEQGRIDFAAIRNDPADLAEQVAFVAQTSPEKDQPAFPSRQSRLAYYINAYNALAMNAAAHSGLLPKSKVRFFYLGQSIVGGRKMSLYALENKLIRPMGEPRAHFALNCMVRGCPRLPRRPFTPAALEDQLDAAAREFFNSPRHTEVDVSAHRVRFSAILKWYQKDFLAQASSLIAYANRYRDHKIPEDFTLDFLPYDWTLNDSRP
ncbi:MAG: DUF547 domain-containing protein [Elusimicrobia bacterium]|nr:DUF547 domain-containing protein [Elusimicrobiota bacterium]